MNELNQDPIEKVHRALNFFLLILYGIGFICTTICAKVMLSIFHYNENFLMFFIYISTFFLQLVTFTLKCSHMFYGELTVGSNSMFFKRFIMIGSFLNLFFLMFKTYVLFFFSLFFLTLKTYMLFYCFGLNVIGLSTYSQCVDHANDNLEYPTACVTLYFASMVLCTVISFLFVFSINNEEKPVKSQPEKSSQEVHTKQE